MAQPGNWHEPVVIGTVEGLCAHSGASPSSTLRQPARTLELLPDESLTIVDSARTPLLEVASSETGPTLRVLASQVNIDVSGKLRVNAESIELNASAGPARVLATEDVIIRGEKVRLN
jgi:hypothetical protein